MGRQISAQERLLGKCLLLGDFSRLYRFLRLAWNHSEFMTKGAECKIRNIYLQPSKWETFLDSLSKNTYKLFNEIQKHSLKKGSAGSKLFASQQQVELQKQTFLLIITAKLKKYQVSVFFRKINEAKQ